MLCNGLWNRIHVLLISHESFEHEIPVCDNSLIIIKALTLNHIYCLMGKTTIKTNAALLVVSHGYVTTVYDFI